MYVPIVLGIPPESAPPLVEGGAQIKLPLGGRLLANTTSGQLGRQTLCDAGQRMSNSVRRAVGRRFEARCPGSTDATAGGESGRRAGTSRGRRGPRRRKIRRRGEGHTITTTVGIGGGGGRRRRGGRNRRLIDGHVGSGRCTLPVGPRRWRGGIRSHHVLINYYFAGTSNLCQP